MTRSLLVTATLLTAIGTCAAAQPSPKAGPGKADFVKADLFIALRDRDPGATLAALRNGADPNGRNWLSLTPLMWAALRGEQRTVDMLLARGAKLDDPSMFGTALTLAELGRSENLALHLLDKGATPNPKRLDGTTPLMLAASNGHVKLMARLLKKNVNVNAQDGDGATALIYAARAGETAAAHKLIAAGANVNTADKHGRTALMYAAANGHSRMVESLLAKGAMVERKDKQGATALLLAARYNGDPALIRSLIRKGASVSATDGTGSTPLQLAQKRGYEEAAAVLWEAGAPNRAKTIAAAAPRTEKQAIESALTVLQTGMKTFGERVKCGSCHHQGLGLMAVGNARQRGYAIDGKLVDEYLKYLGEEGKASASIIHQAQTDRQAAKLALGVDIGDFSIAAGYIFSGVAANGIPANPGFAEMATLLAREQAADGHWGFAFERGPMQSNFFMPTALTLNVLRTYAPTSEPMTERYARAKQWLLTTPAPTDENKAARLMGLKWAGASQEEMQAPLRELLAAQNADGGWALESSNHSDAMTTGIALYALRVGGGVAADDPAIRRGVQYLLQMQDEDGSWYLPKRAMPVNTHFDAGSPHGWSQYASFAATCWATMGLIETAEAPKVTRK